MPSGIAMTVWAANHFAGVKDRDDECLYNLLKAIRSAVFFRVSCISPVEPYDDLTSKMSDDQKTRFRDELDRFIDDAKKALDEPNQFKSSRIWQKHLGMRFPDGADEDTDQKAKALYAAAGMSSRLNSAGQFSNTSGVTSQYNRNYGG